MSAIKSNIIRVLGSSKFTGYATKPIKINLESLHLSAPLQADVVNIRAPKDLAFCDITKRTNFTTMYPENFPKDYIGTGHIFIEKLVAQPNSTHGAGTRAIQKELRESLKDPECGGRLMLDACLIDPKKGHPLGFYYKLGFRACKPEYNKLCEKWLAKGGLRKNAPKLSENDNIRMYLPKENITQCLNYPSVK